MSLRRLPLICVVCVLVGACATEQTGSPLSPEGTSCRTIAAVSALSTDTQGGASTYHDEAQRTCRYDRGANQLVCADQTVRAGSQTLEFTRSTYGSIADFIEEGRVVPPRTLATRTVSEDYRGVTSATFDRVFDGSRRLIRETANYTPTDLNPPRVVTYTAWDAKLRPLTGTRNDGFQTITTTLTYNDETREMTLATRSNVPNTFTDATCTTRYDASGFQTWRQCTSMSIFTTATQVLSTERVCQ